MIQEWQWLVFGALAGLSVYQEIRVYSIRRQWAKREELFQIVTENAADMIALVDVKGNRLYNSPAYKRILGYSAAELGGTSGFDQIHPEDRFKVLEAAREARSTGVGRKLEYRIRHKDGTWRVLESLAGTIRDDNGKVAKLVIVNRDITERKRAEEQAEHNSFHDGLTGLPNRRLFLDRRRGTDEFGEGVRCVAEGSKAWRERRHDGGRNGAPLPQVRDDLVDQPDSLAGILKYHFGDDPSFAAGKLLAQPSLDDLDEGEVGLVAIHNAGAGIDIGFHGVGLDQALAEAVDRRAGDLVDRGAGSSKVGRLSV